MINWLKKKPEMVNKTKPHNHRYTGSGIICDCPSETINIGFEMTHDELLARIDEEGEFLVQYFDSKPIVHSALRAVVELHKPEYWENIYDPSWNGNDCSICVTDGNLEVPSSKIRYPCPTIQAIEKELG